MKRTRFKKDYLTYKASLNGPLTILYSDGTIGQQKSLTAKELRSIIIKGKKQPDIGTI